MLELNKIYHADCLEKMKEIDDKLIDLILCDLPYEVTARNSWDTIIPFNKLWESYERIIKDNGAIVLTATQPFASKLVISNEKLFKYEWIWEKPNGTGFLNAKKQPLRNHEQILVFYKSQPIYNPQFTVDKPYKCKQGSHGTNYNDRGIETKEVITINNGKRYPITVQKFIKDKIKLHPTQKPIELGEYLINTYTNKGDLVLDNCCGSGTFCLAAQNLARNFIEIEKDENYYNLSCKRIVQING